MLPEKQMIEAFRMWYRNYSELGHEEIDDKVVPFLNDRIKETKGNWLRRTREALFLSTGEMAKRLKISRAAYSKLERNEVNGAITIATLAEIVKVMDCELVYAIRPKQKTRFSGIIWHKLVPAVINHHWVKSRSEIFKGRALAAKAKDKMNEVEFRRAQQWSERHPLD